MLMNAIRYTLPAAVLSLAVLTCAQSPALPPPPLPRVPATDQRQYTLKNYERATGPAREQRIRNEDKLRSNDRAQGNLKLPPPTHDLYQSTLGTPTPAHHQSHGAVADK